MYADAALRETKISITIQVTPYPKGGGMKRFVIIFFLIMITVFTVYSETLSFTYALLYKTPAGVINTISPDQTQINLNQDDEIKIFLKPEKSAYIYLFLHSSDDEVYLLFPENISDLECCYRFGQAYTFPIGSEWTGFKGEGVERFILIVSSKRLFPVEKAAQAYLEKYVI
jgi:hypothetical protein